MTDVGDLSGKITRLDAEGLETWFGRIGHMAEAIGASLKDPPDGATTVIGKDRRLPGARRLGVGHSTGIDQAVRLTEDISMLVRRLRSAGSKVIDAHATADADNASGLRKAAD
ncbi:MAG TPA: hypothetical protein VGK54_13800 [Chloroflexota bacterium]|jgi:hypothetical protein